MCFIPGRPVSSPPGLLKRTKSRMFEAQLWTETSWIALNCVHVTAFSLCRALQTVRLLFSACTSTLLLPLSSLRSAAVRKSSAPESLCSADMIMYLGRNGVHTSLCLWACVCYVHVCIAACPSWRSNSWNTWQKIYIFSRGKGNKGSLQMIHGSSMRPARVLSRLYRFLLSR